MIPHHYNAILLLRQYFQEGVSFETALKEVRKQCNIVSAFVYTLRAEWELLSQYGVRDERVSDPVKEFEARFMEALVDGTDALMLQPLKGSLEHEEGETASRILLGHRERRRLSAIKRCSNCRSIIRAAYWRCIALRLYGGREVNPGWYGCQLHQYKEL